MAVIAPGLRVRRCGSYLLGRRVGAGGMAAVFAARQQGPKGVGRLVAVKVMSTAIADDPSFQRMFVREVTIATRLEHPNTVRVYEVGDADGEIYLTMEFVHGASLSALMKADKGPPPLAIALRILCDVARGLHAAHELRDERGQPLELVHQDVSPQNVMVGYDGSVKLLDFGVARIGAVDASRTETIRGKPAYLAPEQIKGERVDRRTDVFALGIVSYELLTGRRLFSREGVLEKYAAVLAEEVPDVRDVAPGVPAEVAGVVARALRREPVERFASADEMRRALVQSRGAAGVEDADESAVGAWVRGTVPPACSPADLEREIVERTPALPPAPDVSELATVVPAPAANAPAASAALPDGPADEGGVGTTTMARVGVPRPARRRWILAGAAGAAAAGGLAAAAVWPERAAEQPGIAVTTSAPPSEAIETAQPVPASVDPPSFDPPSAPSGQPVAPAPRPSGRAAASATEAPAPPPRPASSTAASSQPSSAEAAPAKAFISVWSNISGKVTVDGVPVGDSPIPRLPVKPGVHTVSVSSSAGAQSQSVSVMPEENAKVRFVF